MAHTKLQLQLDLTLAHIYTHWPESAFCLIPPHTLGKSSVLSPSRVYDTTLQQFRSNVFQNEKVEEPTPRTLINLTIVRSLVCGCSLVLLV